MDKRSWPWKKKSSDKGAATASGINGTQADKAKVDNNKKPTHIQISIETYTHLTNLEDQVKSYEEQALTLEDKVKELNEKLSEAHSETINKENLVKQHAKVADEAVADWEKAEAEAESLKNNLESITLLKLTAENRAFHLDGALKECMRQIRNLKEEHDKKLHEVVLNKTKLFDKMKLELEAKMANLDQELLRSAAENSALSRSLHDRSNMLINLNEEKSQAEAEIEILKTKIESCEKELNSHKYELHIAWKDAEIRNEEKNMSVRSAEVANKQNQEAVKKISKLEMECQRLRGLVKKKLPGPAAVAQMKYEVENLGRDYGDSRSRRSHHPEFSLDNTLKFQKENELLTERLLEMEEETKMLREALVVRNSELQTSRGIFAETASKLQILEAQLQANDEQRSFLRSNSQVQVNSQNLTSISKSDSPQKSDSTNHREVMDDFLEMEKLANISNGPNVTLSNSDASSSIDIAESELVKNEVSLEVEQHGPDLQVTSSDDKTVSNPNLQSDSLIFVKLQKKISTVLELMSKEKDMEKVMLDIRYIMQDMHNTCHEAAHSSGNNLQIIAEDGNITATKEVTLSGDTRSYMAAEKTTDEEVKNAISHIYGFIMILGEEIKSVPTKSPKGGEINSKLEMLSVKYHEAINIEINVIDFVLDISQLLRQASELHFNVLRYKNSEVETGSSDCIDKISLPENKVIIGYSHFSDSTSDPDIPNDGDLFPTSESRVASWKCSFEEFEQLKREKDNVIADLVRCTDKFESTQAQLLEIERVLVEVKSQLITAQKSNSLAETQLKCMTESYESLELRAEKLQTEVNLLQGKVESLDNELQEEKINYQEALVRCKDFQEQLQRIDSCSAADNDDTKNQEKELSAAAEKLAECQETIFLLGKQLNSMRPQTEIFGFPNNLKSQKVVSSITEDIDPSEMDTTTPFYLQRTGSESPLNLFNVLFNPTDSDLNNPPRSPASSMYMKQYHSTMSGSSSASSTPTPEKHARGISRFFSSKGKHG